MSTTIVIAGTDTDIGKTVFSAALTAALGAFYWKPIQSGLAGETDSDVVERLGEIPKSRILREIYELKTPASPHYAAELDGIEIETGNLKPSRFDDPLVIELAGGLAVPVTRQTLQIDVVQSWKLPVVLCASTRLGTINHSLLSIEALKRRAIPILGIAFIGPENADSERTICEMGGVKQLGRLPRLDPLNAQTLKHAFAENFCIADILGLGASGP